jgi:hypothetical protein
MAVNDGVDAFLTRQSAPARETISSALDLVNSGVQRIASLAESYKDYVGQGAVDALTDLAQWLADTNRTTKDALNVFEAPQRLAHDAGVWFQMNTTATQIAAAVRGYNLNPSRFSAKYANHSAWTGPAADEYVRLTGEQQRDSTKALKDFIGKVGPALQQCASTGFGYYIELLKFLHVSVEILTRTLAALEGNLLQRAFGVVAGILTSLVRSLPTLLALWGQHHNAVASIQNQFTALESAMAELDTLMVAPGGSVTGWPDPTVQSGWPSALNGRVQFRN